MTGGMGVAGIVDNINSKMNGIMDNFDDGANLVIANFFVLSASRK